MKGNIFIKQRVMACAISIVIVLVGAIALSTLPVEQYPDIAPPTIRVTTNYTGADAKTIIKSVIQPLEDAINGVEDMYYIKSQASSTGEVTIQVFFRQGTNADMAAVNVQNRVSKAQPLLPQEVIQDGVKVEKSQNSILQILSLESPDGKYDGDFIANFIDVNLKPKLMRIKGVGNVQNLGNLYALRIWMKPDVMARYNLSPQDIFNAIGTQSLVAPTGSLGEMSDNTYQYSMEYSGRLKTVEEFNNIVVRADKGRTLRLEEVADIEIGAQAYTFRTIGMQGPACMLIINQAPGANATQVNQQIDKLVEDIKPTLPSGLQFTKMQCSDDFLNAAMHTVIETLVIAIILVVLVVFIFLQDVRATIIPTLSILMSLIGTFAIVMLAGFSLNILTLFALVLAIGVVVDDAIVVVEAVMAKLESGYKNVEKATTDAMNEVSSAVLSCTLVFMAVFIPTMFMSGTTGTFFTQFGLTLAASVGLSGISALTLCPALCVMMLKVKNEEGEEKKSLLYYTRKAYNAAYGAIFTKYSGAVQKFLKKSKTAWTLLILASIAMFWLMKEMPSGLVPEEDQGVMLVEVRAAPGSTLNETAAVMAKVEEKVKQIPELESYASCAGYGMIAGAGPSYGFIIVRLKNWEEREGMNHYIQLVMARFYYSCEDIKDAMVIPFTMPQIPGFGTSSQVELVLEDKTDGDMTEFNNKVQAFLRELQKRPEVGSASSSYSEQFPKYQVNVNAVQCSRAGISVSDVLNTLGNYCAQAYVGNYNQFGKVYRILANALPDYRLNPSSLDNIFIRVKSGEMAPISQFVTLSPKLGSDNENRFNLYQSITAYVNPASGYSEGQAHTAIAEVFAQTMNPAEYGYEYGGMSREMEETMGSNTTTFIYMICILLIYLIMASLYNSWFIPFAVLFSIPFGLMGSFLFSYICFGIGLPGMSNNIYLQTGVIMLIGLLAKTAILITQNAVDKRKEGMDIVSCAFEACKDRLRPILMTVACMVIGMIPLAITGGAGANGNRSLSIGVIGGMTIGTIAMLFVVPAFYIVFQKVHEKIQGPMVEEVIGDEVISEK